MPSLQCPPPHENRSELQESEYIAGDELAKYSAIQLFADRALVRRPDLELTTENLRTIGEICIRLDGLPLAIELAAARIKTFSLPAMLTKIVGPIRSSTLALLTGGPRDLPSRQQTLRDAIAWSYDLLTPNEQILFRRLSVFVGAFTEEASEVVALAPDAQPQSDSGSSSLTPIEGDVVDLLGSLVDKSLLRQQNLGDGESHFHMLVTVREFGGDKLRECGETASVHLRHAQYLTKLAEEAEPSLRSANRSSWMERLGSEQDNLRAALAWCLASENVDLGVRLVWALFWFWFVRGEMREGRRSAERMLMQPGMVEPCQRRAQVLFVAGALAWGEGNYRAACQHLEESIAIWRTLPRTTPLVIYGLGFSLGWLAASTESFSPRAHFLSEESIELARQLDDPWRLGFTLIGAGRAEVSRGDTAVARVWLEEGTLLLRRLGDSWALALALANVGRLALRQGDWSMARQLFRDALHACQVAGEKRTAASLLHTLGLIAQRSGDLAEARQLFEDSLTTYRDVGQEQGSADALNNLAFLSLSEGNTTEARALLVKSASINRSLGRQRGLSTCLAGFAALEALLGDNPRAARFAGAAESLGNLKELLIFQPNEAAYRRAIAFARDKLGESTFEKQWLRGKGLSVADAVDEALQSAQVDRALATTSP